MEQDDVSTSLRTEVRPAEFPTWAEPEPVAEPVSRREEAIAEVLRAALAQGHSDEALTAILRKVLDGASPQAALTAETATVAGPRIEPQPLAAEIVEIPAAEAPLADIALGALAAPAVPLDEALEVAPAADEEPAGYAPSGGYAAIEIPEQAAPAIVERPSVATSAPSWLGSGLPLWGEPVDGAQLWGGTTATSGYTDVSVDEPIWAEVVLHEPAPVVVEPVAEPLLAEEPLLVEESVVEEPVAEIPAMDEPVAEVPAIEEPVVEVPLVVASLVEEPVAEIPFVEESFVEEPVADYAVAEPPVVESPALEPAPSVEQAPAAEPVAAEPAAAEPAAAEAAPVEEFRTAAEPLTATLARTASDPAPMPLDATAVMPPLSLLPPLPSSGRRGGGLPPVPPMPSRSLLSPSRPLAGRSATEARTEPEPTPAPAPVKTLATVTRLPVAPLADLLDDVIEDVIENPADTVEEEPTMVESQVAEVAVPAADFSEPATPPAPVAPWAVEPAPTVAAPAVPVSVPVPAPAQPAGLAGRLRSLGIPEWLLGPSFAADAALHGTYAALTRALGAGLPAAPVVPDGAGEVLFVLGPGVETLRAARSLAAWLRLDPDRVQWATRGDLAGLAPEYSRVTTIETAIERRQDATLAGTVTIVAVDAPLRTDTYWTSQMLAIWAPEAVWAVVDATRKPEDVEPWIDGLPRVDALMVEDTDLSVDPAAVLHRIAMPVALLDGVPATPHRWASLLCERLEKQQG